MKKRILVTICIVILVACLTLTSCNFFDFEQPDNKVANNSSEEVSFDNEPTKEDESSDEDNQEGTTKEEDPEETPDERKIMLFLGDSIAEAIAGPSPVTEREAYGYYGILGSINNYKFYNRAVSGDQTQDLYDRLTIETEDEKRVSVEDDGINMMKSLLSTADIIHISILGNNILGYDINYMFCQSIDNDYAYEDYLLDIGMEYFDLCIKTIHEMNPNATVIIQTLYNPIGEDSPLISEDTKQFMTGRDIEPSEYHDKSASVITRLNDRIYNYLQDNKTDDYTPYYIADVYSGFEYIYQTDLDRWNTFISADGIHPSNAGHGVIACVNQAVLEGLELTDSAQSLERYKESRIELMNRLYKDSIGDIKNETLDIQSCVNMEDITAKYFEITKDLSPDITYTSSYDGEHFKIDKKFSIETLDIFGYKLMNNTEFTEDIEINIMYKNAKKTYIKFFADGTYELRMQINEGFIALLNIILNNTQEPFDVGDTIGIDSYLLSDELLQTMIPGFSISLLDSTGQDAISKAMGVETFGIDLDAIAEDYRETGKLLIRDSTVLSLECGFIIRGDYRIVKQSSKLTGEEYYAIYLSECNNNGESFFKFTYTPPATGIKESIRMTIDVADVVIEGLIHG